MRTCIVGIDCATDPEKRGVAFAQFDAGHCTINPVATGLADHEIAERIVQLKISCDRILFALDAPLGWPDALGKTLAGHQAGQNLNCPANQLFRRETDRFIKDKFKKQPLDVGADRIARTALSALSLLAGISKATGAEVPLAWDENFSGVAAIEVYPAATLIAHGLQTTGYKKPSDQAVRKAIIEGLPKFIQVEDPAPLYANADALDAVLCVLAGVDFLRGDAWPPTTDMAHKEGWIWVKAMEVSSQG